MNVLLACAGRRNYLVHYFKEALGTIGKVFVTDINPGAAAMQEADKAFAVPPVSDTGYINMLLSICKEHEVNLLISLNDLELPILAANRKRFQDIRTIPVVSSMEIIDVCFDKWKTYQFAKTHGFACPDTYINLNDARNAISNREFIFPLVIKPRWGTASIGIDIVYDPIELEHSYNLARKRLQRNLLSEVSAKDSESSILIQEMLQGKEYGLDVVNDLIGNHVCTFVKEKLSMRAGETDKAVTVDMPELTKHGRMIGEHLKHIGNLDCDVFITHKGIYLLEMNPRFGGGYPFSHVAGANIPAALIAWANDEKPDLSWFEIRHNVTSSKCDRLVIQNFLPK